ncbi:MAG: hypothetical protein NT068_03540 [Candidatus Nomurabacteria bacterium]|nr:hypothetical protein [Candidatus Nomurabacteria bacterium]
MKKMFSITVAMLFFAVLFNSCGESQSGQRAKARRAKADSIATAQQQPVITPEPEKPEPAPVPEKDEFVFTPTAIAATPVQENLKDKCGEGQYSCHTFSVDFVLTDSTGMKYFFSISENASNEVSKEEVTSGGEGIGSDYDQEHMKLAKKTYAEMTSPNFDFKNFKFVYYKNSGMLTITKIIPNSGKKIGKVEILDGKEEKLYSASCRVTPAEQKLYNLQSYSALASK